jgi:probable phosphoglycerate mutase
MAAPSPSPDAGRVVLIRHGQTEWSASGQHTSVTDIALTWTGERRAEALPGVLRGLGISPAMVWSSPRRRSVRTAELAGLAIDRIEPDLAEWNYGDYEGLTTAAIRVDRPDWELFTDGCPGGESPDDVTERADRVLAGAAATSAAPGGGDLILVCHGHISRALTVRWVGLPIADGALVAMDPAGVTVLGTSAGRRMIQHANVITHSGGPW